MDSTQAELAIYIFLGIFCVLCPLLVFTFWCCFGDEEVEIEYVKKPRSPSRQRKKKKHAAIVIEETATSSEESDKSSSTVQVSVIHGDAEEVISTTRNDDDDDDNNTKSRKHGTPKPREIVCVQEVSAGSGATSNKVATIDVHKCNSSYCQLCRAQQKTTQFIPAEPLEPTTVHSIRYLPNRWWEVGAPLRELTASITAAFSNQGRDDFDDQELDDDKSLFSRWSKKIRKKQPTTPTTRGEYNV